MLPSDRANFRLGNLRRTSDHNRSVAADIELRGVIVISTSKGAPSLRPSIVDDDPMWRQMTMPSSSQAAKNGSQWSWKIEGQPRAAGSSEKVTAWQPFFATRRTSSAINCGSQIGGVDSGMKRPGEGPHPSSVCQSLYARSRWIDVSRSFDFEKSWPQNCTKLGKHIEPRTPLRFMS